jgi:hypothetical protein
MKQVRQQALEVTGLDNSAIFFNQVSYVNMLGSSSLFVFLGGIGGGIAGIFTRKRIDDVYQFLKKFC